LVRGFARTVIALVAESISVGDLRLKLGAAIGVAETSVNRETVPQAIAKAGTALQTARETGGNHIVEYDVTLELSRERRLLLQADIRRGLGADEFDLHYQPIFDFGTQAMLGVEALLRWPRRAGGPMSPADFIPAAEASGLIDELGLFALRRACENLLPFADLKLSVNVSTVQFRSPNLTAQFDSILSDTGFPPERLQLEITESFLLAHPERAKLTIEELRRRGITIALDDFGTGFSSVGYLRQFKFDRVKLDRTLVDEIDLDPVKFAMVESTMVFAFAMGLAVTAEGVERREEATVLTRLGCREFQGYLFSRPLTLEALARLASPRMRRAG
jgi:EAL domain-containing protein (putative c-di-GMP-specific phosphodiesterase class I)